MFTSQKQYRNSIDYQKQYLSTLKVQYSINKWFHFILKFHYRKSVIWMTAFLAFEEIEFFTFNLYRNYLGSFSLWRLQNEQYRVDTCLISHRMNVYLIVMRAVGSSVMERCRRLLSKRSGELISQWYQEKYEKYYYGLHRFMTVYRNIVVRVIGEGTFCRERVYRSWDEPYLYRQR